MNYFVKLENFLELDKVNFYTIRVFDQFGDPVKKSSEADEFINRFENDPSVKEEFDIIVNLLQKMGLEIGADTDLFRHEDRAGALPPPNSKLKRLGFDDVQDFKSLRLYAMRISKSVVILFNGGIKTMQKALDCPNVASHFRFANKVATEIDRAISNGDAKVNYKRLDVYLSIVI